MKKRDWVRFSPLCNRRGASTVEYVIILVGILALALILTSFLANDGQSMIKDKIIAIINGDLDGNGKQISGGNNRAKKVSHSLNELGIKKGKIRSFSEIEASDKALWRLSDFAYDGNLQKGDKVLEDQWEVIEVEGGEKGFRARAFKNRETGEIVIAYAGTNDLQDAIEDIKLYTGAGMKQTKEAKEFYEYVKSKYGGEDIAISFTGHSLGGGLAEYMAVESGRPGITFNAPGLKDHKGSFRSAVVPHPLGRLGVTLWDGFNELVGNPNYKKEKQGKDYSNQIRNYTIGGDPVGEWGEHPGSTYRLGGPNDNSQRVDDGSWKEKIRDNPISLLTKLPTAKRHFLDNFGDYFKGGREYIVDR